MRMIPYEDWFLRWVHHLHSTARRPHPRPRRAPLAFCLLLSLHLSSPSQDNGKVLGLWYPERRSQTDSNQ